MSQDRTTSVDIVDVYAELRALFRTERKLRRISQQNLGNLVGVGQAAISDWESGRREPSLSHLQAWGRALGSQIRLSVDLPESNHG